jgi:hypothetical protein
VSVEVEPPELARLVDLAERPRDEDWSLRAALVRYAQPQPVRASAVVEVVRRIEGVLRSKAKVLERQGPAVWAALAAAGDGDVDAQLVGVLRAAAELDRLGDLLAGWAVDRRPPRPDGAVDEVIADVAARLDALGVPREDGSGRPPRGSRAARG